MDIKAKLNQINFKHFLGALLKRAHPNYFTSPTYACILFKLFCNTFGGIEIQDRFTVVKAH